VGDVGAVVAMIMLLAGHPRYYAVAMPDPCTKADDVFESMRKAISELLARS
jgi:hypothetical protein